MQPGATIRYLPQEPDFTGYATTLAYVEAGLGPGDDPLSGRAICWSSSGFDGDEDPAHLSGGEARRAALARVLAPQPDILLLDEPTNHLDLPAIEWLEGELDSRRSALVLISHDRRFLANLSRATVWLDRGQTRRIDRGFAAFEAWRDEVLAEEERDQHKLDRKIATEEDWLRYGVTGRRKRNVRRLGNLHALRQQRRDHRGAAGSVKLAAAEADKSGKLVIEAEDISKTLWRPHDRRGFLDPHPARRPHRHRRAQWRRQDHADQPADRRAATPDSGTVRLGANLEMATLDQHRESLDPDSTLAEALTGGRGDTSWSAASRKHVISYMKDFLFAPEQARTPLGVLSGGERGRLMLARALAKPSNLLVLDEPTNDLDLETLDLLEEMLGDYAGTVLLVSHDRDFLDRVVTSVIVPEGDGRWIEYAGGYTDMLAQRGADLTREAAKPACRPNAQGSRRPQRASGAAKRRLNFNEKHALETLPKTIATLQAEIAKQQRQLDDPNLYPNDRQKFDSSLGCTLPPRRQELQAAEDKWLELEMLREEIEQA